MKREETAWHRISSSCWWSPLFTERWGCCLSIWHSVWHSRESPQVVTKLANHKSSHCPASPAFTCFYHTENSWLYSPHASTQSSARTQTHTCHRIGSSISLHLECGNEEEGAAEMIGLKIILSSGRVPGISVHRFMAKSSKNSIKTLRTSQQ